MRPRVLLRIHPKPAVADLPWAIQPRLDHPIIAHHLKLVDPVAQAALNEQRGKGGKRESVYSPNAVRRIVASVGKCEGCGISGKRLVNGYCDVCRSCGANERECTR